MIVCQSCLTAIESHEGRQFSRKLDTYENEDKIVYGYYDSNGNFIRDRYTGEEHIFCEWYCEYVPIDEAYEI